MRCRNPAREIGLYRYAAFLARQLDVDSGKVLCCYCQGEITPGWRSLDHVAGPCTSADQCVAACPDCNRMAGRHTGRQDVIFDQYLRALGVDTSAVRRRVRDILKRPLPGQKHETVLALAMEFFGERLAYQRKLTAARRARAGGKPGVARGGIAAKVHEVLGVPF